MVEYFLATNGKLCTEPGDIAVEDLTTCKEAAEKLSHPLPETENVANWPKGCYLFKNGRVWFNEHTHGSQQNSTRQICKRFVKGMGLRTFLTSMRLLL